MIESLDSRTDFLILSHHLHAQFINDRLRHFEHIIGTDIFKAFGVDFIGSVIMIIKLENFEIMRMTTMWYTKTPVQMERHGLLIGNLLDFLLTVLVDLGSVIECTDK